jgi:NosR/NirI family nitrous oxide reductase transcriptional regulator
VRGGIYDRVQLRQGLDTFTFRDLDYQNLYGLEAIGAPAYNESAIFIVRSGAFSGAYPWKLVMLGNRVDRATGTRSFASFEAKYWVPAWSLQGGRPEVQEPPPAWLKVWKAKAPEIALFGLLLALVATAYAFRDQMTKRATRKNKWPVNIFKYSAWILSIAFVGFGVMAQPSITQVLTWFHALLFKWEWALFLSDPFIFLFWVFIIVTVFVWGRGLFCGWLCPFGSLSELIYKVAGAIGLKRFQRALPKRLHDKLKWVKYGVFFGLLAVSMFSMTTAEMLAEVEPFKTTFLVGWFQRSWPYTLFAAGCWPCRSSSSGRSASTSARWAPRWRCPRPSAGSACAASRSAARARPAPRAAAPRRSTPTAASTTASACTAWTAWSCTRTRMPARPW